MILRINRDIPGSMYFGPVFLLMAAHQYFENIFASGVIKFLLKELVNKGS